MNEWTAGTKKSRKGDDEREHTRLNSRSDRLRSIGGGGEKSLPVIISPIQSVDLRGGQKLSSAGELHLKLSQRGSGLYKHRNLHPRGRRLRLLRKRKASNLEEMKESLSHSYKANNNWLQFSRLTRKSKNMGTKNSHR